MDEIIKKAQEEGRVKDIKAAFKKYPVSEEIHQGNWEYYFAEKILKYESYEIGDIVFVKEYEYQDGRKGKEHLFVMIDVNNKCVPLEYFGLLLSSNLKKLRYKENLLLKKDNKNNLVKDSIVKCDVIYIIKQDSIVGKIGTVDFELIEKYKQIYSDLLKD